MPRLKAVLTGDLISSRKADVAAISASMKALETGSRQLGDMFEFDPRFTRHRGDGWQIVLPGAKYTLHACLGLAASLRAIDAGLPTRIAVGVGAVDHPGSDDLSDAAGSAFEISGDLLDRLSSPGNHERMQIDGIGIGKWQQGTLALADWIARGWTSTQSEAVAMVLLDTDYQTNEARARAVGITRQAFDARLKGSGLHATDIARGAFLSHDFDGTAP